MTKHNVCIICKTENCMNNSCIQEAYENEAIKYAEKYGIIEFKVKENKMYYTEHFPSETFEVVVNLDTYNEESRTKQK